MSGCGNLRDFSHTVARLCWEAFGTESVAKEAKEKTSTCAVSLRSSMGLRSSARALCFQVLALQVLLDLLHAPDHRFRSHGGLFLFDLVLQLGPRPVYELQRAPREGVPYH